MAKDPDISKPHSAAETTHDHTAHKSEGSTADQIKAAAKAHKASRPNNFKKRLEKLGIRKRPNKKFITILVSGLVALVIIVVAVFGVLIYKYKQDNRVVRTVAAVVPYPVVSVNGSVLWNDASYHDYLFELSSVEKFYKSQQEDLTTAANKTKLVSIKKQIIGELQDRILIAQLSRKYKIKLSQKEVDDQFNQLQSSAGGADKVKQTLQTLYGWTVPEFKKELSYKLLESKLANAVSTDPKLNAASLAQSKDIKKQIDAGGDFAALAKKYSADSSAAQGGDLGYFKKGDNDANFDKAAFALQVGQVSQPVLTQYGYDIIKVTDKKPDGTIRASHILIKTVDLDTWLQQQRGKAKIRQYYKP